MVLSLAGNVFDGGALQAQVRAAQATWMQARYAYRGTQRIALQEVEDALVSLRTDSARAEQLRGVVAAADRAAAMARQRFSSGLVDFQVVLDTQRSQLSADDTKAQADAAVSSDQVRLYIALGGGWKPGSEPTIDSAALPKTP
jgi:outer membrane protein TolC